MSVPLSTSPSRQSLLRHSALQGVQVLSLLTPPLYTLFALTRRFPAPGFSINRLLRASAFSTLIVGPVVGGGVGAVRMMNEQEAVVLARVGVLRGSTTQQRLDDYTVIGGAVGALTTTAIFLKRAKLPYALVGGAGLGAAGGVLTHLYQSWTEGKDVSVRGFVDPAATGSPTGGKL